MSFFGRGNENNRTGADSAYRVPIKNALGLDKNDSLVKLKLTALKDPSEYAKDRQEAFKAVVSASVDKVYDQIWMLLSKGTDSDGTTHILKFKDNATWAPHLPDSEIATIANAFAYKMLQNWEDIFAQCIPDSFAQVADKKLETLPVA